MPSDKKKYVMTAIVLASIGAVSGALIAAANMLTANKIEQNKIQKTKEGLSQIFENVAFNVENPIEINDGLLVQYYEPTDTQYIHKCYAIQTNGNNMYGNIAMLVGVVYNTGISEFESKAIYLINNTQTYATEAVEGYVDPFNAGENPDVKCGATYAAKLMKSMIDASIEYANRNLKEGN